MEGHSRKLVEMDPGACGRPSDTTFTPLAPLKDVFCLECLEGLIGPSVAIIPKEDSLLPYTACFDVAYKARRE